MGAFCPISAKEKAMQDNKLTHGLKVKDYVGYALGDMGGLLTFSLISAYQNIFYTDVLHISPGKIAVLILIARLWDAINDPMWGAFIDSRKPTKYGKFRPYIFGFSIPLAVSAVMMFTVIPNLSEAKYLLFAYITYIAYGMFYTTVNIPYGAIASVITDDPRERSNLSMLRSVGAGVGGLPGTIIMPLIVYDTHFAESGVKIQTLNSNKLTLCVLVLAVISVITYFFHFKLTKERIEPVKKQKNYNVFRTMVDLGKNRPFIMLCISGMLLIAFQFYYQSTYTYLFAKYYQKAGLYAFITVCTYLPMGILLFFMNKLIDRFGKKELCAFGMAFSAVASFILYFIRTDNPYVFLVFTFLSGIGQTFLVLEIWALVMDVIDYHEVRTHRREEGTAYALFSFTRKLGQTLAGVGLNVLLAYINYDTSAAASGEPLSETVLNKLYDISTLVPAIILALMAVTLAFGYNLSKNKLPEIHAQLEEIRQTEE